MTAKLLTALSSLNISVNLIIVKAVNQLTNVYYYFSRTKRDVREVGLSQTENKNNNVQTTKQQQQQKKTNQNHKKKKTQKHTQKKCKSFTTMKSCPDTALTDFVSNLKGYLSHKCNVLLQKLKA